MSKRILVVDSNPERLNASGAAWFGGSAGESFMNEMRAIDDTLHLDRIAPYDAEVDVDFSDYDGAVFTGSGVDWNTSDSRAAPLARVMKAAFAAGTPVFGSCNGMQLAASVLGGTVGPSPNGREDGLARDLQLTDAGAEHPLMAGRSDGFDVCCVHRDEVQTLPDGAVLLASNAHSPIQAFAYEQDGVKFWGVQYHPEYAPDMVDPCLRGTGRADAADAMQARMEGRSDLQPDTRRTEIRNWLNAMTTS